MRVSKNAELRTRANDERAGLPVTLTEKVSGKTWADHFPMAVDGLPDDQVDRISFERAFEFLNMHYQDLHQLESDGPFPIGDFTPARVRYYSHMGDCFGFFHRGELVGVFIGTISDWSTYYLRTCSILRKFQGAGRFRSFLEHLIQSLKEMGFDRVEGEVSPANLGEVHLFNKLGFNISGVSLTDRWGAVIRFTMFLSDQAGKVFLGQFCAGIKPQLNKASSKAQSLKLVTSSKGGKDV